MIYNNRRYCICIRLGKIRQVAIMAIIKRTITRLTTLNLQRVKAKSTIWLPTISLWQKKYIATTRVRYTNLIRSKARYWANKVSEVKCIKWRLFYDSGVRITSTYSARKLNGVKMNVKWRRKSLKNLNK